jgi:hypothetical protein
MSRGTEAPSGSIAHLLLPTTAGGEHPSKADAEQRQGRLWNEKMERVSRSD